MVLQLVKKFPAFMDPESSLPCSQVSATCPQDTFTYLLTYLRTPWSRVLLEKLTGFAASQEIPRIYGPRKFITVLTSARQLSTGHLYLY
jgi:hypothetical protein